MAEITYFDSLEEILLEKVDLVLLDLDNTLYSYEPCHHIALHTCLDYLSKITSLSVEDLEQRYKTARGIIHHQLENTAASHSRLFYFQLLLEKVFNRTMIDETYHVYHLYWDTFIANMKLFEDVLPFLEMVKQQNIPIVMVTDMIADIQFKKLSKLGLQNTFTYIVSSEEAGVEKPNKEIFEYAIRKISTETENLNNVIMIGDSEKKDILANFAFSTKNYLRKF